MTESRKTVVIVSHDIVDLRMAGPGIRALELARVLAQHLNVRLVVPGRSQLQDEKVEIRTYSYGDWSSLRPAFKGADSCLLDPLTATGFPQIRSLNIPIVVDLYDPLPLEGLYIEQHRPMKEQLFYHGNGMRIINHACTVGDFFICAHDRQRDWWLGVLQANGRINPYTVQADESLQSLIAEVPFGLPSRELSPNGAGPRSTLPYIKPDDRLILWGGGIWDWLDPLTLLQAMPAVVAAEPQVKLLFPGTRHPNERVPDMPMRAHAFELANELGLTGQYVFFGDWVPYEDWSSYLVEADIAVSFHFNNPETRFAAVRSRILGHIWARTPIVVNSGDVASEIVEAYELGRVVPCGDVEGASAALLEVLAEAKSDYHSRFDQVIDRFQWEEVARPLIDFCCDPRMAPDRLAGMALGGWPEREALEEQNTHQQHAINHLRQEITLLHQEISRLSELVQRYEQGRFISAMRRLAELKAKLGGRL